MRFDENKVRIEGGPSPWVSYDGIGRIGLWQFDDQSLHLDYSLKWWYNLPTTVYPCKQSEIKDVLKQLFQ